MLLRVRPDKDETPANASTPVMELKLKRKQIPEAPPAISANPQAPSEIIFSDPQATSLPRTATRISFKTRVPADKNTNVDSAAAYTDAEVFHLPAQRLTAKLDHDHPGKDAFYLRCDSLKLVTREAENKNVRMMAKGNVFFRDQTMLGTAAAVKYNQTENQLIFEGTPDHPATLHKKQPGQAEDQEISGNQIMYNRKTGTLQVVGGKAISN